MKFKLTLTTHDGVVLETWDLASGDDPNDVGDTFPVPLRSMGATMLTAEINTECLKCMHGYSRDE